MTTRSGYCFYNKQDPLYHGSITVANQTSTEYINNTHNKKVCVGGRD